MERSLADGIDTVTDQKENTNRFRQQTLPSRNHHELRRRGGVLPFFTSNDDTDRDEVGKTDRHEVYPHGERVGPRLFCPRTANRLTRRLLVSPAPDDVREAETALRVSLFFLSLSLQAEAELIVFVSPFRRPFWTPPPRKPGRTGCGTRSDPGFPFYTSHISARFFLLPSFFPHRCGSPRMTWSKVDRVLIERERERERDRDRERKNNREKGDRIRKRSGKTVEYR